MQDLLGVDDGGRYQVLGEDQVVRALVLHGWPYEDRAPAVRRAEQALERWLSLGLPCRRDGALRLFDFCQVANFMKWVGITRGDPVYEECAVAAWRRTVGEFLPPAATPPRPEGDAPTRFLVELRREFHPPGVAPGAPLRLRVPLPYEAEAADGMSLELVEPAPGAARAAVAPGRLEVRLAAPAGGEPVAVEVRVRFTARRAAPAVDPSRLEPWDTSGADYRLYTRRAEGLIRVTPAVERLAAALAGAARDPWQAAGAFWGFFFERLRSGYVHHDELNRADPLGSLVSRGWFDCLTGSCLFAALCRARGIPARVVGGFTLYAAVPAYHYWAELLLPPYGWVPFDLACWDLAAGRRELTPWSDFYKGRLDYRLKAECLPRLVVGSPGVRFPPAWYAVPAPAEGGTETAYHALATRQLLYRDRVRVYRDPSGG